MRRALLVPHQCWGHAAEVGGAVSTLNFIVSTELRRGYLPDPAVSEPLRVR